MDKKNITIEETYASAVENHKKNNFKIAEQLYKKILKIYPQHFDSIFLLGTLAVQTNEFGTAEKLFQKAAQIKPDHANVNYNLGIILKKKGENKKAVIHYQKAIQINPN